MRFFSRLIIFSILLLLPSFTSGRAFAEPRELHSEFKIPSSGVLRERALFWVQIYSKWSTTQGLLHDARYPEVIYEEMDFESTKRNRAAAVRAAKAKYKKILLALHKSGVEENPSLMEKLDSDEKRIHDLFLKVHEPNKFLAASHFKRLRFQLGQKDRFQQGLRDSGRYLPFMEEIFIKKGLPFELTRLPFVESSFNTRAVSKVGASGIWQFMRSTAVNFIEIDDAIDERNDPLRATEAAAELLKVNFESLKRWSLAVTAYNHGRTSLMKAVRSLGTDSLEDLIVLNKAKTFGFASSNFFACLLAAIEVERNTEKYFGPMDRSRPHLFFEVKLPKSILLKDLVGFLKLKSNDILDLNPGLTSESIRSKIRLTKGYRLRLPTTGNGTAKDVAKNRRLFLAGFSKIPRAYKGK